MSTDLEIADDMLHYIERHPWAWMVCFCNQDRGNWWQPKLWLKRGQQHCVLIRSVSGGGFMLVDWGLDGCHMTPVGWASTRGVVLHCMESEGTFLLYKPLERKNRFLPPLAFTCSSLMGEILNLPGTVWTPAKLYRMLKERGAVTLPST